MTTYFVANYYQPPCGYEQILFNQKDQEIDQLKLYIASLEQKLSERDIEIDTLDKKVQNLLQGYTRRQTNYATSLEVWKKKSQGDAEEMRKLREENEKLRVQVASANAEKEKSVLQIKGLLKENDELSKHVANTTSFFKNEIDKKDRAFEDMSKTLMEMAKTVSKLKQTTLLQSKPQNLIIQADVASATGYHGHPNNNSKKIPANHPAPTLVIRDGAQRFNRNERNNGDPFKTTKPIDNKKAGKVLKTEYQGRDKIFTRPSNYSNKLRYKNSGTVGRGNDTNKYLKTMKNCL